MFKVLFNIIINMLASIIQIIVYPLNLLITNALPDISQQILVVSNNFNTLFDTMTWAIGFVPPAIIEILLFILTIEIAKHTIFVSTHTLLKVWNLFQKLKFW